MWIIQSESCQIILYTLKKKKKEQSKKIDNTKIKLVRIKVMTSNAIFSLKKAMAWN